MESNPDQLQSLGVFGIYKESFKIVASWKKIFIQLTLALILPLSIIYLSEVQITNFIHTKINHNKNTLVVIQTGTSLYSKIHSRISSQRIALWIIRAIYSILLLIFSLLSTSAVIYTVASIYTHKEISFRNIMKVVPKVWKRLIVTFLCTLITVVIYSLITFGVLYLLAIIIIRSGESSNSTTVFSIVALIIGFLYLIGLIYICIIWNLACVISVLENNYGFKALKKSKNLIKGKIWVSSAIFVKIGICFLGLLVLFVAVVVNGGESVKLVGKVFLGIFCYLFLVVLVLLSLVTQTVLYFVCKAYHHESIDRSGLAEHLELSYVRMGGDKDDQLGQIPPV